MTLDAATIAGMAAQLAPAIPAALFVAIAKKESGNDPSEVDVYATGVRVPADEIDWSDSGKKYTVGLFQCSSAELRAYSGNAAGYVAALQDASLNLAVYAHALTSQYIPELRSRGWDGVSADGWAFVALGHNMGLARLREKLTLIGGVDWPAFVERYQGRKLESGYDASRWVRYGQAVIDAIGDPEASTDDETELDPLAVAAIIGGFLLWRLT